MTTFKDPEPKIFMDLKDGRIECELTHSTDGCQDYMLDMVEHILVTEGRASILIHSTFPLAEPLDTAIHMNGLWGSTVEIEASSKPLFDAMRAELMEMVARIDTLKFISAASGTCD